MSARQRTDVNDKREGEEGDFHIEPLASADLAEFYDFPLKEHWNPGDEMKCLLDIIPEGSPSVLVGKKGGKIVSTIACTRSDDGKHGWIGLYIVAPEMRKLGLGMRMWKEAMDKHLKGCECVGLDGVQAQQHNYRKSGFAHAPHDNVRYTSSIASLLIKLDGVREKVAKRYRAEMVSQTLPNPTLERDVLAFDRTVYPELDRATFLRNYLTKIPHSHLVIVRSVTSSSSSSSSSSSKTGDCKGFAFARRAADGFRLGPVLAVDADAALAAMDLLVHCLASERDDSANVHLDSPAANREATRVLSEVLGMTSGFTCKRMYWGAPLRERVEMEFGICCWELTF